MTDQELLKLIKQRRANDSDFDNDFEEAVQSKNKSWLSRLIDGVLKFVKDVVKGGLISAILKAFGF